MSELFRSLFLFMKKRHITTHLKRKQEVRRRMALQGKQVKETFGGDTFIFQHPGVEKALRMQDETVGPNGQRSSELMTKEMLEHVVFLEVDGVPTKVNVQHFEKYDSFRVLGEVVSYASKFVFR